MIVEYLTAPKTKRDQMHHSSYVLWRTLILLKVFHIKYDHDSRSERWRWASKLIETRSPVLTIKITFS